MEANGYSEKLCLPGGLTLHFPRENIWERKVRVTATWTLLLQRVI